MSLPRFFVEKLSLADTRIDFDEASSRHIVQVLRMQEGERLSVTDGEGRIVLAELDHAHKKASAAKVLSATEQPAHLKKTCIGISLVKNASRFEWFLEKAAEVGITEIVPLICERTEKQHFRLDRMRSILQSAMLQSQQAWLTRLTEPTAFHSFTVSVKHAQKCIAHCEEGEDAVSITTIDRVSDTVILIGPEGDFSPAEIKLAYEQGFKAVKLGQTRLRTETAGVVAAAFLNID